MRTRRWSKRFCVPPVDAAGSFIRRPKRKASPPGERTLRAKRTAQVKATPGEFRVREATDVGQKHSTSPCARGVFFLERCSCSCRCPLTSRALSIRRRPRFGTRMCRDLPFHWITLSRTERELPPHLRPPLPGLTFSN